MANKFSDILQMIHNTQIRTAIEKMGNLCGLASNSVQGSYLTTGITGNVTGDLLGNVIGDLTGELNSRGLAIDTGGAGAQGTVFGPRTFRYAINDTIVTQIEVDLTGLAVKGDAADDVIGLAAGGAAYIGQHTEALDGIVYRADIICMETPTEETATITTDINITMNSSALLAYDGAASNSYLFNTGGITKGKTTIALTPGLTDLDYIYMTEGDAAAATGEYSGGQFIVRLYGTRLLAA